MKDRITWVPSLLTGELIPKKTSVWDLDDEENEERNDRRQASLMETTPYSRPKNYETNIRIFRPREQYITDFTDNRNKKTGS